MGETNQKSGKVERPCYTIPCHDASCKTHNGPALNTDKDIWRAAPGDYYADRIFVTQGEGIGIDVGGHCIVKPVRTWHGLAERNRALEEALRRSLDTLEEFTNILRRTLPATASLSKDVIADGRSLLSQSVSTPETK